MCRKICSKSVGTIQNLLFTNSTLEDIPCPQGSTTEFQKHNESDMQFCNQAQLPKLVVKEEINMSNHP